MNHMVKPILDEALETLKAQYQTWLKLRHSTEAEREIARTKLKQIESAEKELFKQGWE